MAAAEYYNAAAAAQSVPQNAPYQQSPYQRPHELQGSPVSHLGLPQTQGAPPPPMYQPTQQENKPSVHFTPPPTPPQPARPSSKPSSNRPSFSHQRPSSHGQHLAAPPYHSSYAQHAPPHGTPPTVMAQPPQMRPYINGNLSQQSLQSGHASDPESRRRRSHRRHEHRDDGGSSREEKSSKIRSRSTNADGFLGAAGGGLIGDMIFPGLGTVGGAVAGWLGGKDYGKHRKHREERLSREQREWEHRFPDGSHSDSRNYDRYDHHGHRHDSHRTHRTHSRHRSDY